MFLNKFSNNLLNDKHKHPRQPSWLFHKVSVTPPFSCHFCYEERNQGRKDPVSFTIWWCWTHCTSTRCMLLRWVSPHGACHCQWITYSAGNRCWEMLRQTCAHTSFILHIGVCGYISWLASTRRTRHYFSAVQSSSPNLSAASSLFTGRHLCSLSLRLPPPVASLPNISSV